MLAYLPVNVNHGRLSSCPWSGSRGEGQPDCGSAIVQLKDAVEDGHEYYAEYWELLSIEVDGEACCGGRYRLLINNYFIPSGGLFDWGMTCVEASAGIVSNETLGVFVKIDNVGFDRFGFRLTFDW